MTVPKKSAAGRSSVATPTAELEGYGLPLFARTEFLRAIQRVAPQALSCLRDEVMPKFQQILPWAGVEPRDLATASNRCGAGERYVWHSLEPPLFRWAARFNLSDVTAHAVYNSTYLSPGQSGLRYESGGMPFFTWLVLVATDTLAEWAIRDVERPLDWNFARLERWRAALRPRETSLQVIIPAWAPGTETREGFIERARREINTRLDEYVASVRRELTEPEPSYLGEPTLDLAPWFAEQIRQHNSTFKGSPRAAKLPERYAPEHFDWLVRYQVLERSWLAIAAEVGKKGRWRTVKNGVHHVAERVIGPDYKSWLRRSPPGRPKKS